MSKPGRTASPLDSCDRLFGRYPLAVSRSGPPTMVLMAGAGDDARFYRLVRLADDTCRLLPWGVPSLSDSIVIDRGTGALPAGHEDAVSCGIPLPRSGSLFGWVDDGEVTAIISFHTSDSERLPVFAVGTRAGVPVSRRPPYESWFGGWFWAGHQAGRIIGLAPAIAGTSDQIFWFPNGGDGVIAVKDALRSGGVPVPAGVYARPETFHGTTGPSLAEVLADPSATDLGPRF